MSDKGGVFNTVAWSEEFYSAKTRPKMYWKRVDMMCEYTYCINSC